MTIKEIRKRMDAAGSFWWNRDTMRYFNTKVMTECEPGKYGRRYWYFITSDDNYRHEERFNVRKYDAEENDIRTVGEFCLFKTLEEAEDYLQQVVEEVEEIA